ncbi:MAG: rod shape-determining protein RodA [Gammaproteobacteria bacterium]|jgi:rod shape determining protein RodA
MANDIYQTQIMVRWSTRLHLDSPLLITLLLLIGAGMFVLYSAGGQDMALMLRQGMRLLTALVVMFVMAQIHPHYLRLWTPWVFGVGLVLLVVVLMVGDVGKGAQRWLDLGIVRFQPAEIMKLAMPMMVAWYFAERPLPPRLGEVLIAVILVLVPMGLIAKQPDLGTAMLVGSAGFFAIFLAGIGWRYILLACAMGAGAAPVMWHFMHAYQRQRVLTFLNPESDPLGAGYHIIQSEIAIGSGGLYGKGWLNGTQSQLAFIPERHTDFIFSVFGEEFGLMGEFVLLSLYLAIVFRGLYIAMHAQDTYTRILAGSLSLTFFVYFFVNTGMVTGLLPVVGVPLPLISYGGTSMVTLLAAFGMLMSIQTHRKLLSS